MMEVCNVNHYLRIVSSLVNLLSDDHDVIHLEVRVQIINSILNLLLHLARGQGSSAVDDGPINKLQITHLT